MCFQSGSAELWAPNCSTCRIARRERTLGNWTLVLCRVPWLKGEGAWCWEAGVERLGESYAKPPRE